MILTYKETVKTETIKIEGSDENCTVSGEGFSYTFIKGHPSVIIKNGVKHEKIAFPEHKGRAMKSRAKLVHKYWDSALIITVYSHALKKTKVKYLVLSDGSLKREIIY